MAFDLNDILGKWLTLKQYCKSDKNNSMNELKKVLVDSSITMGIGALCRCPLHQFGSSP